VNEQTSRSKIETAALAVFLAALFSSLAVLVHPWYDPNNDSAMYIRTAQAIAAGEGYTFLGQPFIIRPPGFSVLISPIAGLFGINFHALNGFIALIGAAGIVLLYFYLRPRLGWIPAMLVSLAVWLNPAYQQFCNRVNPDVPGVAVLLGCLLLARWADHKPSRRRDLLLGLAIGLSAYLRSINILLALAVAASRLLSRRETAPEAGPRQRRALTRAALPAAVALIVFLPWIISTQQHDLPAPADQTMLYSYATGMFHKDGGDPDSPALEAGHILRRIPKRIPQITSVLGSRMQSRTMSPRRAAIAAFLVLSSFLVLLKRREPGEFFVPAALLMIALYFAFIDRLMLPVFVLCLPSAVEVVRDAVKSLFGKRIALMAASALVLVILAVDCRPRRGWADLEKKHETFMAVASAVRGGLEPGARIGAPLGFHYSVLLDRPVYSLNFAVQRAGRMAAAEDIIDKYGLNTVILSPLFDEDRLILPYFVKQYGLSPTGQPAYVLRVRP
jgi:hypothetical protein